MSGSSWHFNKFIRLNFKVLLNLILLIIEIMTEFIHFESTVEDKNGEDIDDSNDDDDIMET